MPFGAVLTWIGGGALMGSTLGTAARTLGTGAGSVGGFSTVVAALSQRVVLSVAFCLNRSANRVKASHSECFLVLLCWRCLIKLLAAAITASWGVMVGLVKYACFMNTVSVTRSAFVALVRTRCDR